MASRRPELEQDRVFNLDGPRGNAWSVIGFTISLLKQFKTPEELDEITAEMISGDYLNLLKVADREVGDFVVWETDNDEYLDVLK